LPLRTTSLSTMYQHQMGQMWSGFSGGGFKDTVSQVIRPFCSSFCYPHHSSDTHSMFNQKSIHEWSVLKRPIPERAIIGIQYNKTNW
jgi:hypothetical protein